MTTTHARPETRPSLEDRPAGAGPGLLRAAGVALIGSVLLMLLGTATSPPQDGEGSGAYITSLAADPTISAISATALHYSWVLFALGILAVPALVRGRRGRVVTPIAAVATAFSAIQLSGMLVMDWVAVELHAALPLDRAVGVFEAIYGDPWVAVWLQSGRLVGFVGVPVVTVALARAGVISWWWLATPVLGFALMVGLGMLGVPAVVFGFAMTVGFLPVIVIGWRLLERSSARVRAAEHAA